MARHANGGSFWFFLGMAAVLLLMVVATVQAAESAHGFTRPLSSLEMEVMRGSGHPFGGDVLFGNSQVVGNQVVFNGEGMTLTQQNRMENAFNNSQGIFTTVQNAGNNALIQTATIINITVR